MSIPDVVLALFFLGVICIYAEFCVPGAIIPGAAGSVLVLVSVAKLLSFSPDWRGAALIALALVLFLLEARFVTRGMLTALGAAAMLTGLMTLIPDPPHRIHSLAALAITVPFAMISSLLFSLAVRARRNKIVGEPLF